MSKQIYPSKYTDRKVTDAQYLVDEICERIAKKEKRSLPYKYWNDPYWNKIFRRQIKAANELLKDTNCVAAMAFLRSVKGRNIYSLGLRKQILAGAKEFTVVHATVIKAGEPNLNNDVFLEDVEIAITSEDNILEHKNPSVSLWEKLG